MKSIITFLSIAFLCLSCQKRAPMNLSLPPLEVLQKMEKEEQERQEEQKAEQIEKLSMKIEGIESGAIRFQTSNGPKNLNLNRACSVSSISEGSLIFSCMNLFEKESLADADLVSIEAFDLKLKLPKDTWEAHYESFFYWPENKMLVPLAEHEWRQGKNVFKSQFQRQKINSHFYFVVRLNKIAKIGADEKFLAVENDKSLDLSAFDYAWINSEDSKKIVNLETNSDYLLPDIEPGKTLELDLEMVTHIPQMRDLDRGRVPVQGKIADEFGGGTISGQCLRIDRELFYVDQKKELASTYGDLHFRLIIQDKQYDFMELMALGWGAFSLKDNRLKFQLKISSAEMGKGIKLLSLPYQKNEYVVGFHEYKNCYFSNKVVSDIKNVPGKSKVLGQVSEIYKGTMIIKDSI